MTQHLVPTVQGVAVLPQPISTRRIQILDYMFTLIAGSTMLMVARCCGCHRAVSQS